MGDQVIEVTEKHGPRPYIFDISGTQTIKLEGIDNGYWGGNHGPIMEISSTPLAPAAPEPEPNWWAGQADEGWTETFTAPEGWEFYSVRFWYGGSDGVCGLDVSNVIGPLMIGKNTATMTLNNELLTDPCPGTPKVIRYTWSIVLSQPVVVPEPTPTPQPEPTVQPTPEPTVAPQPPVVVEPTPTPEPTPVPEPTQTTAPTPEPEPQPTPTPEPSPSETVEPEPTPEPTLTPEPEPTVEPEPETSETPSPKPPIVEEPETIVPEESEEIVSELLTIEPEDLTEEQVEQLVSAAEAVLETAEPGSEEYQEALEALMVAAESDDAELPAELAAIPLLGDIAGAALELFNDLGNLGADMAPETRERAEETVIAAVIVGQVAQVATSAAVASAGAAASSAGSSGRRIK